MSSQPAARFSLRRKEYPFELEDEGGALHAFVVREMTGAQRDSFLNSQRKKMDFKDGIPTGLKDATGSCSDLLCLCVYDADNKLVPAQTIQTWPTGLQTNLVEVAVQICGLNRKVEEEAKND